MFLCIFLVTQVAFFTIIYGKEMKDWITIFSMVTLLTPAALAADGVFSRAVPGVVDTAKNTVNVTARNSETNPKTETVARTTASRATPTRGTSDDTTDVKSARTTVSRVIPSVSVDTATTNNPTRTVATTARTAASARSNLNTAVKTVGRNSRVSDASINSNPAVRRAGLVLRPSTAEVGGRATMDDSGTQTGSNIDEEIRTMRGRATTANRETIAEATQRLEQTAALNKSCQEQYNECMDQFCSVVDANQKRCSCSANLSRYTKVEDAVKDANAQLNEVAQRIRYVGLSADEIRAILTETEAEAELSGKKDTSETRSMLEQIEAMIRDPQSSTSYSADMSSDFGLDMDLDFSSESADLFSLDFMGTDSGSSMSRLRGTDLYNAAKKRCKTVLNECAGAGATTKQITGNYDLAIDKDCIAYEQGLNKMNDTLVSNVRSANLMLQKARLAVLQNQNAYDAKGCIAALEACMTDDMVCGDNYYRCVDPTKKYIDENGEVVLGQDISNITAFMKEYSNASINKAYIEHAYGTQTVTDDDCKKAKGSATSGNNDGSCVVKYLMTKIGTKQSVTEEGLCRAVLDKCRRYTYVDEVYQPYNDVVVNYIQRAMVNILAAQHNIISEYASTCMIDVASCYNQQVTQVNAWSTNASAASVRNIMRGACRNTALTCAYAVFNGDSVCWDQDGDGKHADNECSTSPAPGDYIEALSEMFYQSLLCPDNSTYVANPTSEGYEIGNGKSYVNAHCKCYDDYEASGTTCVAKCGDDMERNAYGTCVCKSSFETVNGKFVPKCPDNASRQGDGNCVCNEGFNGDGTTCTPQDSTGEN